MANELIREKSPYLLQHAKNPVHWRAWSPAVFEEAKQLDKPIFLSIGYSTCHWCHVMAHESFSDPETAEMLNRDFLPVKVDREERPDIDAVYMAACMVQNGSGGWPLTVLLTPEQKPFWTGTYLPKKQLCRLLSQAARLWREDRESLLAAGDALTACLQSPEREAPGTPSRELLEKAAGFFVGNFDRHFGGFGPPPKFPSPHNLLFLLSYPREDCRKMALDTLAAMYRGGIFDHVGGGFSRYSTDEMWLVPHFEKMLYDNVLLALAYLEGYVASGQPFCAIAARRTLDYVLGELAIPQGGLCCGQDADSDGREGSFYLWTPEELGEVLGGRDGEVFCSWYGVTKRGNFEGKSIPNLIRQEGWTHEPQGMEVLRRKAARYRKNRMPLHRDDKILTSWNGLAIAALARAGQILQEPRYLLSARRARDFIADHLTLKDGRLFSRWRDGESACPGKLDDYAFYAWGLLELFRTTLDATYLRDAVRTAEHLLARFFDGRKGGFFPYADDDEQLISRNKEPYDGAMPSGNSVAALVLVRLARLTGETFWKRAAEQQLRYLAGQAEAHPAGYAFALLAMEEEMSPSGELLCVSSGRGIPQELEKLLHNNPDPTLSILLKTPENAWVLEEAAPFTGNYPLPEIGQNWYLCQNQSCTLAEHSLDAIFSKIEPFLHPYPLP